VSERTPQRDRIFDEVADRYDPATRRAVRRAVYRGEPPVDGALVPLARAYLQRAAQSSTKRLPRWIPWFWAAFAAWHAFSATAVLAGGHAVWGTIEAGLAVLALAVAWGQPHLDRTGRQGLERSRQLLEQRDDAG
jgi:hypothetical protein